MFHVILFIGFSGGVVIFALRLARAGRIRAAEVVAAIGLLIAMYGVNAWHVEDKKAASEKLSGALVVMEDRLKAGDTAAALGIADRGIRLFGSSQMRFDDAAMQLWRFSVQTTKKGHNAGAASPSTNTPPAGVVHP